MDAGYFEPGPDLPRIHVAELRTLVPDGPRFMRCYPISLELEKHEPGTPERKARLNKLSRLELDEIIETYEETNTAFEYLAQQLENQT